MTEIKPRKVLIISSSGGGGCIQAAIAKEQEERAKDPSVVIIKRDIMKDWYWKLIGIFGIYAWNLAQRKGNVKAQVFFQRCQPAADRLFWTKFFVCILKTMLKEDIDHVIDTQPQGTSAFLLALRIYNRIRKKRVILEKIVVDLPTERNTHFFRPIKKLSSKNRELLRMVTIPPLLEQGQTAEEFWRQHCNLAISEVAYDYYPIRQAFRSFYKKKRENVDVSIEAQFSNHDDRLLLLKTIERGPIHAEIGEKSVKLRMAPSDKLITILLGSQPACGATMNYIRRFLDLCSEPNSIKTPIHLFVFCGQHQADQDSLLRKIADLVRDMKDYPANVSVVPLSFQNDETIAKVFFRSDLTCTRSGGQTAMELMCVMQGEIWVHSEAQKPLPQTEDLTLEQLLRGIPGWEAGSALYLHKLHNAKIVTPESFIPYGRRFLANEAQK